MISKLLLLWLWILIFIIAAPYNKIEECFNVNAMHDLLYEPELFNFDHFEFPGVVSRTFLGALIFTLPLQIFAKVPKMFALLFTRSTLSAIVILSLGFLMKSIQLRKGKQFAHLWLSLFFVQFHFLFYSSRFISSSYGLICSNFFLHFWMEKKTFWMVFWMSLGILWFRFELILLSLCLVAVDLIKKQCKVFEMIKYAAFIVPPLLAVTVLVDSYYWQSWLWPEGTIAHYNIYLNKSHIYGTSPFFWYFTHGIPRFLLFFLPFFLFRLARSAPDKLVTVSFLYIFCYSFLPHKEWRFIWYILPFLNFTTAEGIFMALKRFKYSKIAIRLCFLGSFVATMILLLISSFNYPSAVALQKLHEMYAPSQQIKVHIDTYSYMSGLSRFLEVNDEWLYSKQEDIHDYSTFTHLITNEPSMHKEHFKVLYEIAGYSNHSIKALVWVLERKGWSKIKEIS